MDYLDLIEDAIDIENVEVVQKNPQGLPVKTKATVDIGGEPLVINDISDATTVKMFLDKLIQSLRASNIEAWKGSQIQLGANLRGKDNETLKSLFPTFPEPIEFQIEQGELKPGMKPENVPHILNMNEKSKLKAYNKIK